MKYQILQEAYLEIEQEAEELRKDQSFDDLTYREFQIKNGGNRSKWVMKRSHSKIRYYDIKRQFDEFGSTLKDKLYEKSRIDGNPTKSKTWCDNKAKSTIEYKEFEMKVIKAKLIMEFYEDALKSIGSTTWDVGNFGKTIAIDEGGF